MWISLSFINKFEKIYKFQNDLSYVTISYDLISIKVLQQLKIVFLFLDIKQTFTTTVKKKSPFNLIRTCCYIFRRKIFLKFAFDLEMESITKIDAKVFHY